MSGLRVTRVSSGYVECEMEVTKEMAALQAGFSATVVDVVGTMALVSVAPTKPGVRCVCVCRMWRRAGGYGRGTVRVCLGLRLYMSVSTRACIVCH